MLTALLISLLFGGGSSGTLTYIADSQDSVKMIMAKDERQKGALATLKLMKKRAIAHNKALRKTTKGLDKAFKNHGVTDAEIDALWGDWYAGLDQYNHDMLDLRFQLKEHINREEWEEIFPKSDQ